MLDTHRWQAAHSCTLTQLWGGTACSQQQLQRMLCSCCWLPCDAAPDGCHNGAPLKQAPHNLLQHLQATECGDVEALPQPQAAVRPRLGLHVRRETTCTDMLALSSRQKALTASSWRCKPGSSNGGKLLSACPARLAASGKWQTADREVTGYAGQCTSCAIALAAAFLAASAPAQQQMWPQALRRCHIKAASWQLVVQSWT